jgi:hypothetical protein
MHMMQWNENGDAMMSVALSLSRFNIRAVKIKDTPSAQGMWYTSTGEDE